MDVLLISFSVCVLGVMVTVLIFAVAMRPNEGEEEPSKNRNHSAPSEGFFLKEGADSNPSPEKKASTFQLEFERHVRMEREAAETFLKGPNPDSLHAPSDSPLWH